MAGDWIGWKPRSSEETVDAGVHPVVAKMRMGTFGLAKNPDGLDLRATPWEKGREWSHGKEVQAGGYTFNRRNNAATLGGEDTDPKRQLERLSAQGVNPQDYLKMAKQLGVHPEEGVLGKSADVSLPTSKDLRGGRGKKKRDKKKKEKKKKGEKKSKKKAGKKRKRKDSSSSSSSSKSSSAEESSKSGKTGSRGKRQREAEASEPEESAAGLARQAEGSDEGAVHMDGSPGSLWLTREERRRRAWRDAGEPENAVMLEPKQPAVVVAAVAADRWEHGGQAGIYAIADALWWVKLVVEATGGGCRVVLAEQHMGAPFVRGAVSLACPAVAIGLALSVSGPTASAEWRDEAGTWRPVTRGTGWREAAEQQESGRPQEPLSPLHFGDLNGDDEMSSEKAACRLPLGWKAALMTENWPAKEKRPRITFSEVAAVPAPEEEAGKATQAAPAVSGEGELEF